MRLSVSEGSQNNSCLTGQRMCLVTSLNKQKSGSMLNGLHTINIELTSRCNKSCYFCGHQNPKVNKSLEFGDMDIKLFYKISNQIPEDITIQFHKDGEVLLYPYLNTVLDIFRYRNITNIVTNGMLLMDRAHTIIDKLSSLTISVYKDDKDNGKQLEIMRQFLDLKGAPEWPQVLIKLVGYMDAAPYEALQGISIIRRALHTPCGSRDYRKAIPVIPEIGICLDLLGHPSINWKGDVFICNRLFPNNEGYIGNLNEQSLDEIWNGAVRQRILVSHIAGHRELIPACVSCQFWGIPVSF